MGLCCKPHFSFQGCTFIMRRFLFLQLSLSVLLLCYCGCSGSPKNVATVEGTVNLDGAPLGQADIMFFPDSGARASAGTTDENGKYKLQYTRRYEGAVVGNHKVTISIVDQGDDGRYDDPGGKKNGGAKTRPKTLPRKYTDRDKTELSKTVESGSNTINFELKSK